MTKALYLEDQHLMDFETTIKGITNEGREVILAETAFYPEGGGQPFDTGELQINGRMYRVIAVNKLGENIYHKVQENIPSDLIGSLVRGKIDQGRRQYLMRHHTALHCLNAFMLKKFGVLVTGGQVGIPGEPSRHDFEIDRSLTQDERKECEDWVNAIISESRPVIVRYFTEEETKYILGFCRTRNAVIPASGRIRGIEISGIDIQACGGTHVRTTGEIGRFRIQKVDNKGANLRRIKIMLDQ